ncbi:hypothetical protein [Telmatospirillum sp. J64-1]|uniref:hypothetical protein n=1 Tax=Telmatospirillum sp. J64-1 TaxID=2502183 RepID=UPI00115F3AA8|nr:hypothetical protein [Telmatospirillum sp. J64-1]
MRAVISLALVLVMAASAAQAQGKPRGCLTRTEAIAEREVRHGLRLREMSARCDAARWTTGAQDKWLQINETFGPRFLAQTQRRQRALEREYPRQPPQASVAAWDGRIVTVFRSRPVTPASCDSIDKMLDEVLARGWNSFRRQAEKARDEISGDYLICR